MLTKEKMHEFVDQMPDKFTLDQMIEEIILMQKVERAREQVRNGKYLTEEAFDEEVDKWN